ncbi:hypothetical protein ES703_53443 [subsurface metagenome]
MNNLLSVYMYEKDEHGHIIPNLLFHRTYDRLHSRCIEYPFAASNIGDAKVILDVGSAKADKLWISWLDSLNIDVYATDYDELIYSVKNIKFSKSDIRKLDFQANTFDKIIAVSVIEHIGLDRPQVLNKEKPKTEDDGDVKAFKEFLRVLKPGGKIIMTFPFGIRDELILGNEARNYTENSIKNFSSLAEPILLEYYEYQYSRCNKLFRKNEKLFSKLKSKVLSSFKENKNEASSEDMNNSTKLIGPVTWRCIPRHKTEAKHYHHVEGVLCGVWRKAINT